MITAIRRRIIKVLGISIPKGNFLPAFHQLNREGMLDQKSLMEMVAEILNYLEELEQASPQLFDTRIHDDTPPEV